MQFLTTLRTARAAAIANQMGSSGILNVYGGATPPGIANAPTGTLLATLTNVVYTGGTAQVTFTATAQNAVAGAPTTPTYCRLQTNPLGTNIPTIEGSAGLAPTTVAVPGAVTVSAGVVTAVAAFSPTGVGYPASTTFQLIIVNPSGGDGQGAIVIVTSSSGGAISGTPTVTYGGSNYPGSGVTAVMPQPFDFMFSAQISLGGQVSLTSGTITEGNA